MRLAAEVAFAIALCCWITCGRVKGPLEDAGALDAGVDGDALEEGDALEDAPRGLPICGSVDPPAAWFLAGVPCGLTAAGVACMTGCQQVSEPDQHARPLPSCVVIGPDGGVSGLCEPSCADCPP
jgi:hypothetical protein